MDEKQKEKSERDQTLEELGQMDYAAGFKEPDVSVFKTGEGLNEEVVRQISAQKNEPEWMLEFRLKSLKQFLKMPLPKWGPDVSKLDLEHLVYYVKPSEKSQRNWNDVPESIKDTFDRLGVPQAEQKFLAGVGAQYESEMVYHNIQEHLAKIGVIFVSIEDGLRLYPDLFKKYFSTVVPYNDNKFAALNSAVWSGGSFVYIPKGVHVDLPLQAYFRLNVANIGQFERSLIIADEGSQVHYVEGCTAPQYSTNSFHSGVIEIIVGRNARVRYSTIQNWSTNVYNLVTQRAKVFAHGTMEWVDSNLGSKTTMKYPACYLMEEGAHGEMLTMSFAGKGQDQDAGSKMFHFAPNTTSNVVSKSISKNGGRSSYRGFLKVMPGAENSKANVVCDALILDGKSQSDTYPSMTVDAKNVSIGHEASVSKIGEEQLFYLMSRGLSEEDATTMVVSGFIEPLVKELPMEYAVEMNRLIQLQMTDAVG